MSKSRRETHASAPVDPSTRRILGFDLDADSWMGRLRGYCAGPQLGMLGPYELIATAGRGGQGLVFKARQPRTGREVAVKRLAAGQFATPDMRARFQREVEAVAALSHPHIVTVYGSEEIDGLPVLVMQWVDGVPFDQWARPLKVESRPVAEILDTFLKVCGAVEHAHKRGVIHRDLKPTNVLVDQAGEPHVLDFGLARRNDDASNDPTLTLSGAVLGTPAYAPPEQLRGDARDVDERSDVYSLGALLYRALTGRAPVDPHLSPTAMAEQIERAGPRSPAAVNPALDREVSLIVLKALQPEPAQRYESVAALADDVQRFRSGRPVLAHPPGAGYRLRKFVRRNSMALIAAGMVTLGLAAAAVNNRLHARRADSAAAREEKTRDEFKRLEANRELDKTFETAVALESSRKFAEAEPLYRKVLARRLELVGDKHPSVAPVACKLGYVLRRMDRFDEADPFLAMALEASIAHDGPDRAWSIYAGIKLAWNPIRKGDYRRAEQICQRLPREDVVVRDWGEGASFVRCLIVQQRFSEAIDAAKMGVDLDRARFGARHRYVAADHSDLGDLYRITGDTVRARIEYQAALQLYESLVAVKQNSESHSDLEYLHTSDIGYLRFRLGQLDEAEIALRAAVAAKYSNSNLLAKSRRGVTVGHLGEFLLSSGRAPDGEQMLIEGQAMINDPNYIIARFFLVMSLIDYYESNGRDSDAAHWRDCLARRPFGEWLPPGARSESTDAPGTSTR